MLDFIAFDLEVADSLNSAPCSLGYAISRDGKIVESGEFLINPDTEFSPIAMRIHKISPEMVRDKPVFSTVWPLFYEKVSDLPLVAHNASYDVNVLMKAAERYDLSIPETVCYCTYEMSQKIGELSDYKLKTVCKELSIPYKKAHNAEADAVACASVMLELLGRSVPLPSPTIFCHINSESAISKLEGFERDCLREIKNILIDSDLSSELIRFSKKRTLNIDAYYQSIHIGKVRGRFFLAIKEKHLDLVDSGLEHSETKTEIRFYIDSPQSINLFSNYIISIAQESIRGFSQYKTYVSEKTVNRNLNEYKRITFDFLTTDF